MMAPMDDAMDAMPEVAAVLRPVAVPSLKGLLSEEGWTDRRTDTRRKHERQRP